MSAADGGVLMADQSTRRGGRERQATPAALQLGAHGRCGPRGHNRSMPISKVRLPRGVRQPFQVYLNGVPQELGTDYVVRESALVFERDLRKDKISGWRWLLGAWGVGTYRQNDSVDVRYEAADGSPRVAEALEIEPG